MDRFTSESIRSAQVQAVNNPVTAIQNTNPLTSTPDKLQKYKTGDNLYDLSGYLKDNPGDTKTLVDAGFRQEDVDSVSSLMGKLSSLEPYKTDGGYDLTKYLIDHPGDKQTLLAVGFNDTDITKADKIKNVVSFIDKNSSRFGGDTNRTLGEYLWSTRKPNRTDDVGSGPYRSMDAGDQQALRDLGISEKDIKDIWIYYAWKPHMYDGFSGTWTASGGLKPTDWSKVNNPDTRTYGTPDVPEDWSVKAEPVSTASIFQKLQVTGKIPHNAKLVGVDKTTGDIQYNVPDENMDKTIAGTYGNTYYASPANAAAGIHNVPQEELPPVPGAVKGDDSDYGPDGVQNIGYSQSALDKLVNYRSVQDTGLIDFSGKVVKQPNENYDIAKFLRDNQNDPLADSTLRYAGFSDKQIEQVKQYNQDKFATGLPDYSKESQNVPKISNEDFIKAYVEDHNGKYLSTNDVANAANIAALGGKLPDDLKKNLELRKDAAELYVQKYGKNAQILSGIADVTQLIVSPTRVIRPEVTLKDISSDEWQIGGAQVVLLAAPGLGGAIGGIGGTVASKSLQLAAGAVFLKDTIKNWGDMTPTQRAVSVAMDTLIIGGLPTKANIKATGKYLRQSFITLEEAAEGGYIKLDLPTRTAGELKTLGKIPDVLEADFKIAFRNLQQAISVGDDWAVAQAGKRLRKLAEGIEDVETKKAVMDYANHLVDNAEDIVKTAGELKDKVNTNNFKENTKASDELIKLAKQDQQTRPTRVTTITKERPKLEDWPVKEESNTKERPKLEDWPVKEESKPVEKPKPKEETKPAEPVKTPDKKIEQSPAEKAREQKIDRKYEELVKSNPDKYKGSEERVKELQELKKEVQRKGDLERVKKLDEAIRKHKEAVIENHEQELKWQENIARSKTQTGTQIQTLTKPETKPNTKTGAATKTATLTETATQTDTATKTATKTKTETQTQTETKTAIQTKPLTKTKTETKTATENKTQVLPKTKTQTKTKPEEKLAVKLQNKIKTKPDTGIKPETKTTTKTDPTPFPPPPPPKPGKVPVPPPPKPPPPPPPPPKKPIKIRVPLSTPELSELPQEKLRERFKNGVTWKQGIVWWAVNDRGEKYVSKKPIAGVKQANAKTAFKTVQLYLGKGIANLSLDMGIMDVQIKNPKKTPGAAGAIRFKLDKMRRTTGDVNLSNGQKKPPRPPIRAIRQGKIIYIRNVGSTRRMPKGRII